MSKEVLHTALIAIAAYVVIAAVQKQYEIPVVGGYLPKGR